MDVLLDCAMQNELYYLDQAEQTPIYEATTTQYVALLKKTVNKALKKCPSEVFSRMLVVNLEGIPTGWINKLSLANFKMGISTYLQILMAIVCYVRDFLYSPPIYSELCPVHQFPTIGKKLYFHGLFGLIQKYEKDTLIEKNILLSVQEKRFACTQILTSAWFAVVSNSKVRDEPLSIPMEANSTVLPAPWKKFITEKTPKYRVSEDVLKLYVTGLAKCLVDEAVAKKAESGGSNE